MMFDHEQPDRIDIAVFSEGFEIQRNFETFPSQNEQIGVELIRKWCKDNGHEVVNTCAHKKGSSKIWKTPKRIKK